MQPGTAEFSQLWPTALMRLRLPGAEQANAVLADVIEQMNAEQSDMTTDYLSGNFLSHPHPAINWLKTCLDRAILDYARGTGVDYDLDWHVQAWPNVNGFGDYHNLHNHPHSWLSGTYYVRVPSDEAAPKGRSDRTPNAISFFDPRPQANMLAIKNDPQVDPEHRVQPEGGDVLIWPGFLHHLVHVNLSQTARISVSFNVILRMKPEYVPD